MSNERDYDELYALADVIGDKPANVDKIGKIAAARRVLAAGYRKPRTITTAEELDALAVGSIVLDCTGDAARKFRGGWRTTVAEPDGTAWLSGHMEDADMPATVLHEPTA